ncbi:hypothetical protein Acsp05_64430 [Actinokineospora sp. NBRC 105648]|nr:hypothetical protein Acsp05_64430 [Actinokineospora sp. NBRC 105648]
MTGDGDREDVPLTRPNGCRWCGLEEREHYRRWKPPIGWHHWVVPTDDQRKQRMRERRERVTDTPEDASGFLLCG